MITDEGNKALGTKRFQEETNRSKQSELQKKICVSMIDSKTGWVKASIAEDRPCPLCGEPPTLSRIIFTKDGFPYRKCSTCSVTYVSPVLRHDFLSEMYTKSDYAEGWMSVLLNPTEQKFNQPKFENGLKDIEETLGGKGKLLEVGCAVGQFLSIADDTGWDTVGIELNQKERTHCRKLGLNVIGSPLTADSFPPESFDAIAMWEVLEHVPDPRDIVRSCQKLLKPGGVLLIVVPNVDALAARILQEQCNMFLGISHITMFNEATLSKLLREEGFDINQHSTFISEFNIINNFLSYEHPYLGEAKAPMKILEEITEEYILGNGLGYKLKTIATKI